MNTKYWIILITAMLVSSTSVAQEKNRTELKCYLQIADNSSIVHQFVNTGQDHEQFLTSLADRSVFMADGVTKQKIITVYECVTIKDSFKSKEAREEEKDTAF